jgi:hypothetical protein
MRQKEKEKEDEEKKKPRGRSEAGANIRDSPGRDGVLDGRVEA